MRLLRSCGTWKRRRRMTQMCLVFWFACACDIWHVFGEALIEIIWRLHYRTWHFIYFLFVSLWWPFNMESWFFDVTRRGIVANRGEEATKLCPADCGRFAQINCLSRTIEIFRSSPSLSVLMFKTVQLLLADLSSWLCFRLYTCTTWLYGYMLAQAAIADANRMRNRLAWPEKKGVCVPKWSLSGT